MTLTSLNNRPEIKENLKLEKAYKQLDQLLKIISDKELSNSVIETINKDILEINTSKENSKKFRTLIKKKQLKIAQLLEKKMNLVTKNHYRNIWLSLGMAAFGIPLGVSFGASLGNMGLLGVGLPIGMLIGMAIGKKKDEKAQKEGRQLNIDLRY